MLQHSLDNEISIYQKLALQTRNDFISNLVLARVKKEIETMQKAINEQKRKESPKHSITRGVIQRLCQALYRCWNNKDRGHNTVLSIPSKPSIHEKETTR